MRHTILATIMLVALSFSAEAYDFKKGDLYYTITERNYVEVTKDDSYSNLTSITIPQFVINGNPYVVTSIGENAFSECSRLTSVTFAENSYITSIGKNAFSGCNNLAILNFQGTIDDWLKISFGNTEANPLSITHHLYIKNEEFTDLVIPDNITEIKSNAFYGCLGLTSVTIPNSVTSIGSNAFTGCDNITTLTYNSNNIGLHFSRKSKLSTINIGDSVSYIYPFTFQGCSGLTSVNIPNSVTSIGWAAFEYCSGLKSITIPDSVKAIGDYAFDGCSGLASVTIPNSVTSIGNGAFGNVKHIVYNGSATGSPWGAITMNGIIDGDLVYTNAQKDTLIAYIGTGGDVTIPNSVTIICDEAFYDCTSLTSVNIPNSVKSIGNHAFDGCSGLTSLTIPNSVTSIGKVAFYRCSSLTSATIPNSVTSIGYGMFSGCGGLTSITIPNSVTSIGSYAFSGCGGLTSITIPNSVTSIGLYAFRECTGLTSISFAEDSKFISIDNNAFYGCSGLTSVSIPNSVTSIGRYAFEGCTSSIFYCQATEKPSGWDVNWNIDNRPVVWGCKAVSLSANDNTFGTVSGGCLFPTDSSINITAISAKHYHFVKWSDGDTENPRTIKVTTDTTFTAVFAIDTLKVNTFAENGTVSGTGAYTYGTQTSLTATPAEHYHFAKWNDGNTENPRSITVTTDMAFTAMFAIDTLKVTASAENGTVLGAGLYAYGTSILLGAIPAEHYHFAKWSDGNTENPRSITVTEDITLVAIFEKAAAIDTLKVTASAENGTVFGAGEYTYGISILLVATPAEHYHFAKWSDGNTENPRSIKVTSDTTLIAVFAIDTLKVNTFAENGTVSGAGLYAYGTQTSLTATPAEHYHFAKWSDGNIENPRSITVTEDITLVAIFEKAAAIDTLKVTASAENGTVFGAGEFAYGTSILLGAIPAEHYHFAKWSDGNTENPRSITVTEDIALEAIFEKADDIDTLKVTASAENGTVFGAGEFAYGTSILLGAIPAEHYHFAKWSDGNTENPRSITVTEDITLVAIFEKAAAIDTLKVTASAENGTVFGAGEFAYGATTSLTATPAEHYHFVKWNDNSTENPRSIKVTSDTTLIAVFAIDTLKVTAFAENGTVSGAGLYAYGTQTSLTATPAENYHFVKWSDGNTENPRSITVTENITLIAIFEKADAISTDAVADVKIYAHHNVIVVENATDDIYVYDAMGRLIARNSDSNRNAVHHGSTEITMQNTGIYIVRTGDKSQQVAVSQN